MSHTYRMSVVQACAETEAAIQRARSLFASEPEPAAGALNGGSTVQTAAQSTTTAGQITSDLSGAFIATHKAFVEQSAPRLSAGAQTDADCNPTQLQPPRSPKPAPDDSTHRRRDTGNLPGRGHRVVARR